jgi:hypothetical protein
MEFHVCYNVTYLYIQLIYSFHAVDLDADYVAVLPPYLAYSIARIVHKMQFAWISVFAENVRYSVNPVAAKLYSGLTPILYLRSHALQLRRICPRLVRN